MRLPYFLIIIILLLFFERSSYSQSDSSDYFSGRIKVTAGKHYDRSGLTEFFLGKHWRKLWITPFQADIIDLEKFGGGLTPYKRGGGLQTKSLRFKGNDGKTYKFRSMDKDPRRILPPDLQESVIADAFQDQISASNPLSALIASHMLNEIGVLNAEPIVVIMPADEKLGEFKKDFGNVLGTFEESPDNGSDGEKGFAESDKVLNSFKLYKKLEKDNDNRVDITEFLKARLFDLMIGDWDRHSDQWLWAGYKKGDETIYQPIPRDRDQAFSLYDGLIPFIVGQSITQIEGYSKDYPKIYDLSFNGRYLDRRFLPGVEKRIYDSLTAFIQNKITDEVITKAARRMPEEWYKLEGRHLEDMIKSRRDNLKEASDEFYDLINETVDIYGSSKDEYIEINNAGNYNVEIKLFKKDKQTGGKKGEPFFVRAYNPEETNDIRLYLNGGEDIVVENGINNTGIDVVVIRGKDKVKILTNDIPVYKDNRPLKDGAERYEPKIEDRGYDWRFGPELNYNSDDGLILGGGPILYKHSYGAAPYVFRMSLLGGYAFNAKSYSIKYTGDFYTIIKGVRVTMDAQYTRLAITRFFGPGNETVLNKDLDKSDFYKVGQGLFYVSPNFEIPLTKKIYFTVSPFYKYSDVSYNQNTLLGLNPSTYGIGGIVFIGAKSSLSYDSRDNIIEPFKGVYAKMFGNYTPNIFKKNFGYSRAGFDLRGYISTGNEKGFTFVMRAAGGKVWGNYPFYESMFLGGENSLKGYSRERFAGDGLFLAQSEVRARLFRVNILLPGMLGISAFGGVGRVFLIGDISKRWHNSFGGSAWITYLNRAFNVGFTVAKSDEGFKFFFGTGLFL